MHSLHRHILARLLRSVRFLLLLAILVGVEWKTHRAIQHRAWWTAYHLDAVQSYYKVLSPTFMTMVVIPFYLAMTHMVLDILAHPTVMLKYRHLYAWWQAKWVGGLLLALIVSMCINFGLIGAVVSAETSGVSVTPFALLTAALAAFVIQTSALAVAGTCFGLLALWTGKPHIGFLITVGLCFLLHTSKSLLKFHWALPDEWMALTNLYPLPNHLLGLVTALVILVGACGLTWWLGRRSVARWDVLWGDGP